MIGRLLRRQGNGKNDLIPKKSPTSGKHTPALAVTPYWGKNHDVSREPVSRVMETQSGGEGAAHLLA